MTLAVRVQLGLWLAAAAVAVGLVVWVVTDRPIENPTTPTEVSQAWLDAFQDGDLETARSLSCAELRPHLTTDLYDGWTRLAEGSWDFRSEQASGDTMRIEAWHRGDIQVFTLGRVDNTWRVCDPFEIARHR